VKEARLARIIDAHVHLWNAPRRGYVAVDLPHFPFPAEVDGTAETLLAQMDANGVARAIVVQSPWWRHDDRYLMEVAGKWPERLTPVGCLPFVVAQTDVDETVARIGRDGMQGLRIHVSGPNALKTILGAPFRSIFSRLSEAGLPVLLLSANPDAFEAYAEVCGAFPELKVVIEHMGYAITPPLGGGPEAQDAVMRLARFEQVRVKLAIHHQHSQAPYPWSDLIPLQQRFMAEFGASRLMWGSNWPMREPTYAQRLETLSRHFPFRSADDRDWILGRTAETLWPQSVAAA
jgi:predicted TIM-barrel fold metal-dependent hydrolase